jgi:hypothetical protein
MSLNKLKSAKFLSTGDIAQLFGVPESTARTVIDRLGLGTRHCGNRMVPASDLDTLRIGLRAFGYPVPEEGEEPCVI